MRGFASSSQIVIAVSAMLFLATHPTVAQSPLPDKKTRSALAQNVPAKAPVFVSIRSLAELDAALRNANAWRLWRLVSGDTGDAGPDLRADARTLLGPQAEAQLAAFEQVEIGLIAPSWRDLGRAVWLVRLPDPTAVDEWFPAERRAGGGAETTGRLFRTRDGVLVTAPDAIAVAALPKSDRQAVRDTFRLVSRGQGESLSESPPYRDLLSHLRSKSLALAFLQTDPGSPQRALPGRSMRRLLAGLYVGEQSIDIALRGELSGPLLRRPLGTQAVERLLRLPATTLAALAMTVDAGSLPAAGAAEASANVVTRYLGLLNAFRLQDDSGATPFPTFGPHVLAVWDQDLTDSTQIPQAALLIESPHPAALAGELERVAAAMLESARTAADGGTAGTRITYSTHFGARLARMPLGPIARVSSFPMAQGMEGVELAWTVQGDWVIVATSRAQLQRIIEAQFNLVPTLANVPEVQALRTRRSNVATLVVAQPDLIAAVLEHWTGKQGGPSAAWLDAGWWNEALAAQGLPNRRLGIGMRSEQEPGSVVVARVYEDTPAEGRLDVEDRILGINGLLLDFASPNADLRRRWFAAGPPEGHLLRVMRDDIIMDVRLPHAPDAPGLSGLLMRPADAVRELATFCRTFRFATWAIHSSDNADYSALISLRFADAPQAASR